MTEQNKPNEEVPFPVNPDEGQQFPTPDPTFPNPSEPTQPPAELRAQGSRPDKDYHGTNATKQKGDEAETNTNVNTNTSANTGANTNRAPKGGRDIDTAFDSDNKDIDQDASEAVQDASGTNGGRGGNNG